MAEPSGSGTPLGWPLVRHKIQYNENKADILKLQTMDYKHIYNSVYYILGIMQNY